MRTISLLGIAVLLAAAGCSRSGYADEAAGGGSEVEAPIPTSEASQITGQNREAPPVAPKNAPVRAVIRNGELTVRVANVEQAEDKVAAMIQAAGGYVDSAESSDLAGATPTLNMKLKVPVAKFDAILDQIEALGTRMAKKVGSEDVTASLVDMNARLKVMRSQEEVYRRMLAKSSNSQEMMDVQDKLMNLRGMIESLEGQQKSLSGLAALSTIELTLQQSSESIMASTNDPNWAREAWGASVGTLGSVARIGGTGFIWAAVFSPIWLPIAWFWRSQRRPKRPAPGPNFDIAG